MNWNIDGVMDDFRALARERNSAAEIAREIVNKYGVSVTRGAVIGKANREAIKLQGGRPNGTRVRMAPEEQLKRRRDRHVFSRIKRLKAKLERQREAIEAAPVVAEIPTTRRKTILQLHSEDCRWPIGDPSEKDFWYCGNEKLKGFVYCAGHVRMAYRGRE